MVWLDNFKSIRYVAGVYDNLHEDTGGAFQTKKELFQFVKQLFVVITFE
jgi:hypothetical protein